MLEQITAIINRYALACHPAPGVPTDAWAAWLAAFVEPSGTEREYCPRCGGELRERKGKRGRFLGCESYPACRFTKPAPPETPPPPKTNRCPLCRQGRFVSKTSERGNVYRQCNRCGGFEGARFLTDAERPKAAADKARRAARKAEAKARAAAKKSPQRELVLQLPVEGFDYSEWWGDGWTE